MTQTYKMNDSSETYEVADSSELVEIVKSSNAHTRDLGMQEYIAQQSGVMENLWGIKKPETLTADSLVEAWVEGGIVSRVSPSAFNAPRN